VTNRVDELGHSTRYSYDEFNRVTSVTDPLGRTTTTSYAEPGGAGCGCSGTGGNHPTVITLPSGKSTEFTYDTEWQKLTETTGVGTPDQATTQFVYDQVGNVVTNIDPRGKVWSFTYDNRNRRETSKDPLGNLTRWTYDAAGNNLSVIRPDGGITTNVYDNMNRLVWTRDPAMNVTQFGYDSSGNMTNLTDARTNTYSFTYDAENRRTAMIYPGGSRESYVYDGIGNLAAYTNRAGNVRTHTYDNRNRETYSVWDDGITPAISRAYDSAGRLTNLTSSVSALAYTHDNANQLLSESSLVGTTGSVVRTVAYTYDMDGNRLTLTYPDGTVLTNSYTARNQLAGIGSQSSVVSYQYDLSGNRIGKVLGNGTSATYVYDDASRLLTLIHSNSTSQLARFDYALNSVGNRTSKTEVGQSVSAVRSEVYTYDPIDQLTGVAYGTNAVTTRTVSYDYDPVGNRTNVTDNSVSTSYAANNLNQYTQLAVSNQLSALSYDLNGNLTGHADWTYTYDAQNRLISASSSSNRMDFAYDARNRCVRRTSYGSVADGRPLTADSFLTYDSWSLLEERNASGTLFDKYIHGATIDELIVRYNGTPIWYHHDGLGSTIALTDNSGSLTESYTYDVFGTVSVFDSTGSQVTNPPVTRFLYTSREYLSNLGLYDYRNRFYSQTLGRFWQVDPIRFQSEESNLYLYISNTIVNGTDPYGLKWRAGKTKLPGRNTIICDGKGGVDFQLEDPRNDECFIECIRKHEQVHKDDALASDKDVCKGKPAGVYVGATPEEVGASDEKAYKAEFKCLEDLKKTACPDCIDKIQKQIDYVKTRIPDDQPKK
jgi:RHS repeat-associated protein